MSRSGTSARSRRPISISSEVKRSDAGAFVVGVGDTDAGKTARYFEARLGQHSVRAEWDRHTAEDRRGRDGFAFRLSVDGSEPRDVVYRDGAIYEPGATDSPYLREGSFLDAKETREALLTFWIFDDEDVERAREIAPRFGSSDSTFDSAVTEWAGCEADFAGAGAGVGATIGGAAGGIKGAGAGAVVGGVVGAAFGLGYCTAQAVCG